MSYIDTEQFIRDFNAGNDKAFEEMYKEHSPSIYAFTLNIIRDREEAEEITADTFFKVYRAKGNFKTLNSVLPFLYTTARNACIDHLRRTKVAQTAKEKFRSANANVFIADNDELDAAYFSLLKKAIDRLPNRQKEVIQKFYLEEMSYKDVASDMGVDVKSVQHLRVRAMHLLREILRSQHLTQEALLCGLMLLLSMV